MTTFLKTNTATVKERIQVEFFIYKQLKENIHDFQAIWACNNTLCLVNDTFLVHLL